VKAEQLEAIHRLYDAMNRRDMAALRALGKEHPNFSWESNADELDSPGRLDGDDLLAYSTELFHIFDELETELMERIDVSPEQVIFVVRHGVRGAASGVRVDRSEVHLWTVRGDQVESLREYRTVEEALEAAAKT
jgi:ketosteroid isomerase-like protein